ncbi:MAG: DUF1080 domain-containing protein [Planctomycetota bacterium]|nr:MAG: DUF1080 domain-containing protein [Planctomycetota bacterium]
MMRIGLGLLLVCSLGWSGNVFALAPDAEPVYADPAEAAKDPDFAVQGEYVGRVTTDEGSATVGAQVIALGNGHFEGVMYIGGLPGDGWTGEPVSRAQGARNDKNQVVFQNDRGKGVLADGKITVIVGDRIAGVLEKVERKSPTLGMKPPKGAVVLFDGTTPDNFIGGRMTPDGLLMEGATSKQKFQSFRIHLEFRTPFKPTARGQARGNSGFYAQGRYEVQILDSFGLSGEDNECGGIYKVARPRVNMCFPPLSWQTYDVEFHAAKYEGDRKVQNARITVRHNGVLIHENQEVPHATTAAPVKEGPEPGPIFLQNHGNPVRFRNIFVVPLED